MKISNTAFFEAEILFLFPWDRDHNVPLLHLTTGKEQIQRDDDTLNGKTFAFL
jgi:hypothetical protein